MQGIVNATYLSALGVGQPVRAYYLPTYAPQYVPTAYYEEHRDLDYPVGISSPPSWSLLRQR